VNWAERDGEHGASVNAMGIKVLLGVGPSGKRFLAWCIVVDDAGREEWVSWAPMMADSIEAGKALAEERAVTVLEAIAAKGARATEALRAMGYR
jgi:hypothetical protein